MVAAILAGVVSFSGIRVLDVRNDAFVNLMNALASSNLSPDAESNIAGMFESAFSSVNTFIIVKTMFSGLFAVAAFTYGVAWIRRYYNEDVEVSREMQRLSSDIARASWVIEAIHEVKHEQKGELPVEWVEAVTRNLFGNRGDSSQMDEGVLALRALMGFTANASFGPEGPKFEIGKKGAKDLSRSIDPGNS